MSFITTDNLTHIMAEMSDYCNAACPMCNRYDWNLNLIKEVTNSNHTTLDFVKRKIGERIIKKLEAWTCQGTYGDALMNPETIQIFEYLRQANPNIAISMITNGGTRNTDFWTRMAQLKVHVIFSIDGLADTNHLYRRNVRWDKLMSNAKAFISAGGSAEWNMLIFKHNQHQVDQCRQFSKEIGFIEFKSAFSERWQDYNSDGDFRDITKLEVDDYVIEKPLNQEKNFIKKIDGLNMSKNDIKVKDEDHFFKRKIRCWACNENKREIYLRANGYVSPCCILGDVERNEPKKIINDFKKINLNHTDLEDILNGDFFQEIYSGINGGNKRLHGCYNACGVN